MKLELVEILFKRRFPEERVILTHGEEYPRSNFIKISIEEQTDQARGLHDLREVAKELCNELSMVVLDLQTEMDVSVPRDELEDYLYYHDTNGGLR